MDNLFAIIGILLFTEAVLARLLLNSAHPLLELPNESLTRLKLICGVFGLAGTLTMFLLLQLATHQFGYDDNYVQLDLIGIKPSRGVVYLFLLAALVTHAFPVYSGIFSGTTGRAVTAVGRAATARRAATVLKLEPRQTEALVYIYEHHSMTLDDFKRLYPEADSPSLEQDLQALVKLGLMVPQGDKFVMT